MEIFKDYIIDSINFSISILVDISFKMLVNYIDSFVMDFIKAVELTIIMVLNLEDIDIKETTGDIIIDIKELNIKLGNKDLYLAIDIKFIQVSISMV